MRRHAAVLLFVIAAAFPAGAASATLEGLGQFGGGLFVPSGDDADLVQVGPAFSMLAAVGISPRLGFETEFAYVPIRFEEGLFPFAAEYRGTQISVLVGPRLTTGRFLGSSRPGVGYLALRLGMARLVTTTDGAAPAGSWIGGAVEESNTPSGAPGFTTRVTDRALAVSPRVGAVLRVSDRAGLDIALHPVFIYNRGDIATQVYVSLNLSFWAWQTF